MGHKPTLQDLKDVHPTIYHSLQKLLTQDGVAQLGLVFQVCQGAHQLVSKLVLYMMLYLTLKSGTEFKTESVSCAEPVGIFDALCVNCESQPIDTACVS